MLRPAQLRLVELLDCVGTSVASRRVVGHYHRNAGKSFVGAEYAIETIMKSPGPPVLYLGPTEKQVRGIVMPNIAAILKWCPPEIKPAFNKQDSSFVFPNGELVLGSSDRGFADSHRGKDWRLVILDESAFYSELDYLIKDVLMPRVIPVNGRILLISTSPKTPSHPFGNEVRNAIENGTYLRLSVDDNPLITPQLRAEYVHESEGEHTSTFKREYLCELVVDEKFAVLPGKVPVSGHTITPSRVITSGYIDLNSVSCLVVCVTADSAVHAVHEIFFDREEISPVLQKVMEYEARWKLPVSRLLWGPKIKEVVPKLVSMGFSGSVPENYSIFSAPAGIRTMQEKGTLFIDRDCQRLARHCSDAVWNDGRTRFESSGDGGHFEGVHALGILASVYHSGLSDDVSGLDTLYLEDFDHESALRQLLY